MIRIKNHQKLISAVAVAIMAFSTLGIASTYAIDSCEEAYGSGLDSSVLEAMGCKGDENNSNAVPSIVTSILYSIISVSGLIAAIFIVVGGINYMKSTGEPDRIKTAKNTIIYSLLGLAVTALAFVIVNFTISTIPTSSGDKAANNAADGGSGQDNLIESSDFEDSEDITPLRSSAIIDGSDDDMSDDKDSDPNEVSSIRLAEGTTLKLGEKYLMQPNVFPSTAKNPALIWSSDKPNIVSVNQNGEIEAKGSGTATITTKTPNGVSASTKITVSQPVVANSIAINQKNVKLTKKGAQKTLTATISPNTVTDKTITWSSNKKSVATVNNQGVVTAKGSGAAKITATTSNGKKATVNVTVYDNGSSLEVTQSLLNKLKYYHQTNYTGNASTCSSCTGCGSCGLSAYMAGVYALRGKKIDYMKFANEACRTRFFNGKGAEYQVVAHNASRAQYEKKYKVKVRQISVSWDEVVKQLKKGNVIINYVKHPPSILTRGAHYVTSLAYRDKNGGEIYIWNPNTDATRNKGDCDKGECWYSKSEYMKHALGSGASTYVMSKLSD